MREAAFKKWLQGRGYDAGTVGTQLARAGRLARAYGDLDALHAGKGLERLQRELAYSKDDERAGKASPAAFAIDGNLYNGLVSFRKTIDYYRQFIEAEGGPGNRRAHMDLIARLSTADIEATMDVCDASGVDDFLRDHGYVRPSNWVVRPSNGQRYPAKAIVGIAVGMLAGESPLRAKEYFGGFGESQSYARLKELGYTVVGKDESGMADKQLSRHAVEAAMDEYDTLGQSAFLAKYERGLQGTRYWVRRIDTLYPSKAIANAAFEIQLGERGSYGGTEARRQLVRLGYTITNRDGRAVSGEAELPAELETVGATPVNLILYGPPGTGKTYATAAEAVRLCGEEVPADREALKDVYDGLVRKGRIEFVTFHQSYSYEDFVEGLRPVTGADEETADGEGAVASGGFSLKARDGIFKRIADLAGQNRGAPVGHAPPTLNRAAKIFKMSLGRSWASEDDHIYEDAIRGGYVVIGYGGEIDWSGPEFERWDAIAKRWREVDPKATGNDPNITQIYTFRCDMEVGSLVVVSDGNLKFRAIGEITGPYRYERASGGEYNHCRPVRWLWHGESLPRERIYAKQFSQVSAYRFISRLIDWDALEQIVASGGEAGQTSGVPEPYVLIIDEINRANISKVFGELITLIEPDKRLDAPNALTVKLPYSDPPFGVPGNLHIVGTMNTADRSIALLDTALRRRFEFRELMPDPGLLDEDVDGIPLRRMLTLLNERIEYLFDREHQIGHAFFMNRSTRTEIDRVMRNKVIPLLQEYFYEDWAKVAMVLGDAKAEPGKGSFITRQPLSLPPGLSEEGEAEPRYRWQVRDPFAVDAYDRFR